MQSAKGNFVLFEKKMKAANLPPVTIETFKTYYDRLVKGDTGLIPESDIRPVKAVEDLEKIRSEEFDDLGEQHIGQTVVIKLNGGLGTSMGMQKAKSLLTVKDGLTFLDIIVRQTLSLSTPVPVVFMNSFSTRKDTLDALEAYPELNKNGVPLDFLQHKVPKVDAARLTPVDSEEDPSLSWCPPGHGDLYQALVTGGVLDALLEKGYRYAFVSNADNLGAFLDATILGYFIKKSLPFMMEVADRSEADKKGGHLAKRKTGGLVLREIAQTPESDIDHFQDIRRHKYFNTNNIWIDLRALKRVMRRHDNQLRLPMIRNRKTLDPRDSQTPPVYQLETAMGAAIAVFKKSGALRVPRTRFIPVKDTNDLLAVRSDSYILTDNYRLIPNPKRKTDRLEIDLDPDYYKLIDRFERRFPFGAPSLRDCEFLKVDGDIRFGKEISMKGGVALLNEHDEPYDIGNHQTVQGTMRI